MLRRALPLVFCLAACGQVSAIDNNLPPVPTINSFTAIPAALGATGGTTMLTWTVVNEDNLSIEPGRADVTGFTDAKFNIIKTTTYTLTAGNSLGEATSSVTVTVGP